MELIEFFSTIEITVPLSQLLMLLVPSTLSLLFKRVKFALLVNYMFAVYWGYFLNQDIVYDLMVKSGTVATIYFSLGIGIAILAMIGFTMRNE